MEHGRPQQCERTDENIALPCANIGVNQPGEVETLEGALPDGLKRLKRRMVADRGMA